VTALVDRLEAAGMVARRRHPEDRRSVIIELTHTGSATLQTAVGLVSDRISAAVEQETPEQVEELQRMLEQIAASLRSGAEDRSGIAAALGRQALPEIGDPSSLAPAQPPLSADLRPSTE
jgi:DNA-binding PadR family transcriptional regulator